MEAEIKINFPPKFEVRYGHGKPVSKHLEQIFENRLQVQLNFLEKISSYTTNYLNIPLKSTDVFLPHWDNGWFPTLDAMSLYTMLATQKPSKYIEIGSGNSTKFARRAIQDHMLSTQIISIDPQPRAEIDEISDMIIRSPLEEVDLSIFLDVTDNDIIFFDGSHRCFQNSDVTVFFIDIIPVLQSKITIGIHDVFWPSDYPPHWINRYYSEQYVLAAYMIGVGVNFPIVFGSNFVSNMHKEQLTKYLHNDLQSYILNGKLWFGGGCLWFNKP